MREENFIAFWLVFGFFVGLLIGFMSQTGAFDILSVVAVTTLFFYLMAHVSVALFVRFMEFDKVHFEKEAYDRKLDYFYNQLLQREREVDTERVAFAENEKGTRMRREERKR
ncbi:hypothetical protein [Hydrogenimonas sp.]